MALSVMGWLNGISSLGIVSFGLILGIYFIFISKKSNVRLLTFLGFYCLSLAVNWSGIVLDFFNIILTGQNLNTPLINRIIWSLIPLNSLLIIYVACELLIPNKKWYLLSVGIFVAIAFILALNLDLSSQIFVEFPNPPGEDVVLAYIIPFSFSFFVGIFFNIIALTTFTVTGFLTKAFKSADIVRKRYAILAVGYFFVTLGQIIEGFLKRSFILVITRTIMVIGLWIIFLGLKEITEKPVEKPKKDTIIKDSLFRVSKRPDNLTEEEVTVSKEKKICLVCKGNVAGFNIFICTECGTFYCAKCAKALSQLENACWVCDGPIDESKPVKPYKKEEGVSKPTIQREHHSKKVDRKK